jgi:hypothetical protein
LILALPLGEEGRGGGDAGLRFDVFFLAISYFASLSQGGEEVFEWKLLHFMEK